MFLPYLQRRLCGNSWTKCPEPDRVIGLSLLLLCLGIRHHVPRGCPAAESDPHEECFTTQPAGSEKTGRRAQQSFSGVAFANAPVSRGTLSMETPTLHRCVVQRTCGDQQPQ